MKARILDSRADGLSKCFLCSVPLEDYVGSLPETYDKYEIQRGIVSNVYLDRLVETVLEKRHIPPIVLVVDDKMSVVKGDVLSITKFKILDGLQRTFRLQSIRKICDFAIEDIDDPEEAINWNRFKFSREFSKKMKELGSGTSVLRAVLIFLANNGEEALRKTFSENRQWFEIWRGLTPEEEVRKMLTLNAGHKPVTTRHQLELLFLNILPEIRSGENASFGLVREKDQSSTSFSKDRQVGHFHFAHVISALLSFKDGAPITPSVGLIQDIQSTEEDLENYLEFASPVFLREFTSFLAKLDKLVSDEYGPLGVSWIGREVTLAGICGAIGSLSETSVASRVAAMKEFLRAVTPASVLSLNAFEDERNSVQLSKVNIGSINRKAIFNASVDLITKSTTRKIIWSKYFTSYKK